MLFRRLGLSCELVLLGASKGATELIAAGGEQLRFLLVDALRSRSAKDTQDPAATPS